MNSRRHAAPGGVPFAELVGPVTSFAEAVIDAVARMWAPVARSARTMHEQRKIRDTAQALMTLSDHTLRDIGLERSEIWDAARHAVERPGMPWRMTDSK